MKEIGDGKVTDKVKCGNVMHQARTTRNNEIEYRDPQPDNGSKFFLMQWMRQWTAVPSDAPTRLNLSAFYRLGLQSHDPPAFFIEANDIVFQSRSVMFYPIDPRLAIS